MTEKKKCARCRENKRLEMFSRDKTRKCGRFPRCKACVAEYHKKYRKTKRGRVVTRGSARRFQKTDKYKFWRAKDIKSGKVNARAIFRCHLLLGRIQKKPCLICGTSRKVHGHHEDYSKPLDVIWLCPQHHSDRHRELAGNEKN